MTANLTQSPELREADFTLSRWARIGDGSYEIRRPGWIIYIRSGPIGMLLFAFTLPIALILVIGAALGNSKRRQLALADLQPRWVPLSTARVRWDRHGLQLIGFFASWSYPWTDVRLVRHAGTADCVVISVGDGIWWRLDGQGSEDLFEVAELAGAIDQRRWHPSPIRHPGVGLVQLRLALVVLAAASVLFAPMALSASVMVALLARRVRRATRMYPDTFRSSATLAVGAWAPLFVPIGFAIGSVALNGLFGG